MLALRTASFLMADGFASIASAANGAFGVHALKSLCYIRLTAAWLLGSPKIIR